MGSISDDDISLTSTVESEQQSEYEVETILAEDHENFDDGTRYLIQWTGYPLERCSWEPADCLDCSETLLEWQQRKQKISEGKEVPFDTDALEARIQRLQDEKAERKRRRAAKRHRVAESESDHNSKVVTLPIALKPSSHKVAGTPNTYAPGPRPRSLYQDQVHPARQDLSRPPIPKAPPAVMFGNAQPAPRKVRQTEELKFAKTLSTKWKYEKLGRREQPPPNPNVLDLRRPSDWNSMPSVNATKPGRLRLITDENEDGYQTVNDTSSVSSSPCLLYTHRMSPIISPRVNDSLQNVSSLGPKEASNAHRDHSATEEPSRKVSGGLSMQNPYRASRTHFTAKEGSRQTGSQFNLVLPPRVPAPRARFIGNSRWWNPGDYYCTMYFGPEKREIGNARLCGIGFEEGRGIYRTKVGKVIEVWFKDLCSLDEYQELCDGRQNHKISNGWIEGFNDNEPEIRRAAETLWDHNQVAIAYINKWEVLLAYPPRSPVFGFLDADNRSSEQGYLNLTLREALNSLAEVRLRAKTRNTYLQPAGLNYAAESDHLESERVKALSAMQLHGFDVAQERDGQTFSNPPTTNDPSTTIPAPLPSLHSARTEIPSQSSVVSHKSPPPTDSMDLDAPTLSPSTKKPSIARKSVSFVDPIISDARHTQSPTDNATVHEYGAPAADFMDVDARPSSALTADNVVSKPVTVPTLDEFYDAQYGITFDKLATITGTDKPKRAEMFYVWFPEQFDEEKEQISRFLKKHTPLLYSNSNDSDWDRFVFTVNKSMMQGAVIFHGSFNEYHKIPSLKDTLWRTKANFWSISLSQPLDHVNPPMHLQQLFPHGGVFLLTEDFILRDADSTMIILDWFYDMSRKRSSKTWKIMLRPNIMTWVRKQMDRDNSRPQWLAIYLLLLKLGCTSNHDFPRNIEDDANTLIISPPVLPKYGTRTPDEAPDIPKECTQEQRNADHLAEYFAGWSLLNAHRFRKFVIVTLVEPIERWKSWQHIEIKYGARSFFEALSINYRKFHAKLTKDPSRSRSSNDASGSAPDSAHTSGPFTPRTPSAPDATSSSSAEHRPASSAHQPLSRRIYAQPYQ